MAGGLLGGPDATVEKIRVTGIPARYADFPNPAGVFFAVPVAAFFRKYLVHSPRVIMFYYSEILSLKCFTIATVRVGNVLLLQHFDPYMICPGNR
jgi:hypothetical protein